MPPSKPNIPLNADTPAGNFGNPFKYGLASIAKAYTSDIAYFAGMIGTGLEALGMSAAQDIASIFDDTPDEEKDAFKRILYDFGRLVDNFGEAGKEGLDASLFDLGANLEGRIKTTYGTQALPSTTAEVAADYAGLLMPIPLKIPKPSLFGSKFSQFGSRVASGLTDAAALMTNFVASGPGFGKRALIQGGVTLGAGEGIKALIDRPDVTGPLMFSDQARGITPSEEIAPTTQETISPINFHDFPDAIVELMGNPTFSDPYAPTPDLFSPVADEYAPVPDLYAPQFDPATPSDPFAVELTDSQREAQAKQREMVIKQEAIKDAETMKDVGKVMLTAAAIAAAYFGARNVATRIANRKAPLGLPKIIDADGPKTAIAKVDGALFNENEELYYALKELGHSEHTAQTQLNLAHNKPVDIINESMTTGRLGQGFVGGVNKDGKIPAMEDLQLQYTALSPDAQELFDKAMLSQTVLNDPDKLIKIPGLYKKDAKRQALIDTVAMARRNPDVRILMDLHGDAYRTLLEFSQHMGAINNKVKTKWLDQAEGPLGQNEYMALYTADPVQFGRNLFKFFGIGHTPAQRASMVIGPYRTRTSREVTHPLSPTDALRRYWIETVESAIQNQSLRENLSLLSGVQISEKGLIRTRVDLNGNVVKIDPLEADPLFDTSRGTTYIGRGEILEDETTTLIKVDNAGSNSFPFKDGSVYDIKFGTPGIPEKEIFVVQYKGDQILFHVPDPGVRAALNMREPIGSWEFFFRANKNLLVQNTTGMMTPFSPISHLFTARAGQVVVTAERGPIEGLKFLGQGVKGTGELMRLGVAKETAAFLAKRIANLTSMGRESSDSVIKMQNFLERVYRESLLSQIRRETGKLGGTLQAVTRVDTIDDMVNSIQRHTIGGNSLEWVKFFRNLWVTMNNAVHEGPAFAVVQRYINRLAAQGIEITPERISKAIEESRRITGDFSVVGSSNASRMAMNTSPYFGPLIHGARVQISAAFRGDGMTKKAKSFAKWTAAVSATVVAPTVTEMLWNEETFSNAKNEDGTPKTFVLPGDDTGRQWTHREWHNEAVSTEDKLRNMIFYTDDTPPWNAFVMPFEVDFLPLRGLTQDTFGPMFGFQKVTEGGAFDIAGEEERSAFFAGLAEYFNFSPPPILGVGAALLGDKIETRPQNELDIGGESPGRSFSFFSARPFGSGSRYTGSGTEAKFEQQYLSDRIQAVIQAMIGANSTIAIEGINQGMATFNITEGDTLEAIGSGVSAAASAVGKSRAPAMLFQDKLFSIGQGEIEKTTSARATALSRMSTDFRKFINEGLFTANGTRIIGNTVIPFNDPIYQELTVSAKLIEGQANIFTKQISDLMFNINSVKYATEIDGEPAGERQKRLRTLGLRLQLRKLYAEQNALYIQFETAMSGRLTKLFKMEDNPIKIDLLSYRPAPNLN